MSIIVSYIFLALYIVIGLALMVCGVVYLIDHEPMPNYKEKYGTLSVI